MKNKHLSIDERLKIENGLNNNLTFKEIGRIIEKDCTTVSKEIRNHIIFKNIGAHGRKFFDCKNRKDCPYKVKGLKCNEKICENYEKEKCPNLNKPPYVCNGCKNLSTCTLSKQFYDAGQAQNEYKDNLAEARTGITYTVEELETINNILKPLVKENGQSIHHAISNNKNRIMCSEREAYILIDLGVLEIRNIDLPRKVRFRQHPKKRTSYKIDKKCLEGRRYEDFLKFKEDNDDINIVEMDSVEGIKGGKVLLTLHFVNCSFMLAFIRENNDAQSVIDIFNDIERTFGIAKFKEFFPVILTDNGSEFSNPLEIEYSPNTGEQRTKIFYCEPGRPDQKGACEVNHEMIRRILPKGTSFNNLNQDDINLIMSNINSYNRKKLNNCCPIQLFSLIYGNDIASKFGIFEVNSNDINLTPNLIKKD